MIESLTSLHHIHGQPVWSSDDLLPLKTSLLIAADCPIVLWIWVSLNFRHRRIREEQFNQRTDKLCAKTLAQLRWIG
jgi:hypothetical protein